MKKPSKIVLQKDIPRLEDISFEGAELKDRSDYDSQLDHWQHRMLELQQAFFHQGQRGIVIFQGVDASGKGGCIRRLSGKLDPRGYRVYPIGEPAADEQGRHYLYRFQKRLPPPGMIAIFDRSWYERVLAERVKGIARPAEWQRAYQEINEFERMLLDDGVKVVKIYLHITRDEQLMRFKERIKNPVKQWKITAEDIANRELWDEYWAATNDMFSNTSTEQSPWHAIPANRKWYARIETMKTVYQALATGINTSPPPLDEELIKQAEEKLGICLPAED